MSDNIYEATKEYIIKYDEYDLQIRQTKLLLLESMNEYIQALQDYFNPVFNDEFKVDIRGELIFLQTQQDINKDILDAIKNLSQDTNVEFEVNIADTEKTILIYINSLTNNEETETEENGDD